MWCEGEQRRQSKGVCAEVVAVFEDFMAQTIIMTHQDVAGLNEF